jgi:signal transduction histidine kinase/HAMP domain-containing protein
MLARLRVGTKLMLLVLVPVCALLGFTVVAATSEWRHATDLRRFRAAVGLSFTTAKLADAVAAERLQTVMQRLRPGAETGAALASAQRDVDDALRQATASMAGWHGSLDAAETVDVTRRQVRAMRTHAATGTLSAPQADSSYSLIVDNLEGTIANLDAGEPTGAAGRAAGAYLAIRQVIEANERERIDLAQLLAGPGRGQPPAGDPWATVARTELEAFRGNADGRLTRELDALLFEPASLTVQEVRDRLATDPPTALHGMSLAQWLSASGGRIGALRHLEGNTAGELASTVTHDLGAAQGNAIRDMALSLAVLVLVTGLGLVLRRSITGPLQEVSEGARALSSGDLTFEVGYTGRDEIGDVAAALGQLRASAERLAREIRSMNAAVGDGRLDHRADVGAVGGTWSQLLTGMNATMAAFADLHHQEAAIRRVATLVAKGVPPDEIFGAVVAETRELLDADAARLARYEADGTVTIVAACDPGMEIPVGTRLTLDGASLSTIVQQTGRPASREIDDDASGPVAALLRGHGIRAVVAAPIIFEGHVWGMMVADWRQVSPTGDAEGRISQFTELVATAIANAHSRAQLSASRARVVAASDEARRRIERDLHDGVQQRLVSLGLELRNAEATLPGGLPELHSQLERVAEGLTGAFDELRAVSRGIHPAILSVGGLGPALRALARRSRVPVELALNERVRLPEGLEVAIYYVVSEALTNVAKHAQATAAHVQLRADDSVAELEIADDGVGGADPERGSGLIGLADRVEAIGGTIRITSPPGQGTVLRATLSIAATRAPQPTSFSPRHVELRK